MRTILISLLSVGLSAAAARTDDTNPKAVIDKALQAMGGEEHLKKIHAATFTVKGEFKAIANTEFTSQYSVQPPTQSKEVIKFDVSGMIHSMTRTIDGDKGWMIFRGKVQDMPPQEVARQKDELYANWVATIVPLKDSSFKLASLGETQVNGKPAAGVNVMHAGHSDIKLYFDKASGLLVKAVRHARGPGGREGESEFYYSDYKDFDGVKQYTKLQVTSGGKEIANTTLSDFKPLEKLDKKAFERPAD
jgi:hypothetical protein